MATDPVSITLHTLGRLAVFRDGEEYPALISQKLRCAVLLYLAVEGEATRDTILALLWPDREEERGRHALSQTLYELRQAFGPEWLESHGERLRVTGAVSADARDFEEAVEDGDVERAAELYRGPFLEGVHLAASNEFESWADRKRAQLRRSHRVVRREVIDRYLAEERLPDALAAARRWVALEPLDDEAQHRLIELLARSGQRSEALRQYERFGELLEKDDLEPLEDTRALVEEIRRGPGEGGRTEAGAAAEEDAAGAAPEAEPRSGHGPQPPFEFMRRRIWLIPIGYAAVSFVILELASMVFPLTGLGDDAFRLTAVVVLLGFPLVIAVAWLLEPALWPRFLREQGGGASPGGRAVRFFASLLVALAGMAAIWGLWPGLRQPVEARGPTPLDPSRRLAVLYFQPDGEGPEVTRLAHGLTESLITELGQIPDLRVVSEHGVRPYRDGEASLDSIARALTVGFLVTGRTTLVDDTVRVNWSLVDAGSHAVVEGGTLTQPRASFFGLVNELLDQISLSLRPALGREVRLRALREGTDDVEAWERVQEAEELKQHLWDLLSSGQEEAARASMDRVRRLLEEAARIDPDWPEPRLLLGWLAQVGAALLQVERGSEAAGEIQAVLEEGIARADSLVAEDPDNARAWELRGVLVNDRRLLLPPGEVDLSRRLVDEALADLQRAVAQNDALVRSWRALSELYMLRGEYREARAAAERAHEEDPYLRGAQYNLHRLAMALFELRQEREAEAWCKEGLRRYPRQPMFVDCVLTVRAWGDSLPADPDVAWSYLRGLTASPRPDLDRILPHLEMEVAGVLARAGMADSARGVLERARSRPGGDAMLWPRAAVHLRLGEEEVALSLLERLARERPTEAATWLRRRIFSRLEGRPEFESLMAGLE